MAAVPSEDRRPRGKIRVTALLLGLLALGFYLGFIALTLWGGQ